MLHAAGTLSSTIIKLPTVKLVGQRVAPTASLAQRNHIRIK